MTIIVGQGTTVANNWQLALTVPPDGSIECFAIRYTNVSLTDACTVQIAVIRPGQQPGTDFVVTPQRVVPQNDGGEDASIGVAPGMMVYIWCSSATVKFYATGIGG
jgi:hypothetical protein